MMLGFSSWLFLRETKHTYLPGSISVGEVRGHGIWQCKLEGMGSAKEAEFFQLLIG